MDTFRFERLVEAGTAAAGRREDEAASALLKDALDLWRGEAVADIHQAPFARGVARGLADQRLLALEKRIQVDLRLGRAPELIAELRALVAAHPYHEPFHEQLMLALYRSGRQTEALDAFRRVRTALAEELAIEPGPGLAKLEQAILRHDPHLQWHPAAYPHVRAQGRPPPQALPRPAPSSRRAPRRRQAVVAAGLVLVLAVTGLLVALRLSATATSLHTWAVHANAVVFVDPARSAVLGQADTRGRPAGIAAGFGHLWVTDPADGRVLVLNPATFQIEDQIPVGRDPTGVAADANGIWVTDPDSGTVSEINPASETVVASVTVGTSPSAIAAGAGGLWVIDAGDGAVTRVDPGPASVVETVNVGQPLAGITVGLGLVWLTSTSSGQLIAIDPRSDQVTETIAIGNGPASLRVVDGAVWVANPPDDTVSRFDPATGEVRKLNISDPTDLVGVAGSLWVASGAHAALTQVNPAAAAIVRTTALANPPVAMVGFGRRLALVTLAAPATHQGSTLRVVAGGGVDSVDPGAAYSADDWQLLSLTNDGMLTYARISYPGGAALVPDLATGFPLVQDGGRTFTFHMRRGVRYSNGAAVRPEDFRRGLEREYQAGTGLAALGVPLVGARRCGPRHGGCNLDTGVTLDDAANTVTYHLSAPDPAFLYQLALPFGAAVPSGTHAIGPGNAPLPATGPYLISSYLPGRRLLLVRNPRFHPWSATAQPAGFPAQIFVRLGLQPGEEAATVAAGRADVMLDSPPVRALANLWRRVPEQMHTYSLGETDAMFLNTRLAPFNRIAARRALDLAVDRSRIVRLAGGPALARATCQILPPHFPVAIPIAPLRSAPAQRASGMDQHSPAPAR